MCGVTPLLPLYTFMACAGTTWPLSLGLHFDQISFVISEAFTGQTFLLCLRHNTVVGVPAFRRKILRPSSGFKARCLAVRQHEVL
jgi:hypothetical protein